MIIIKHHKFAKLVGKQSWVIHKYENLIFNTNYLITFNLMPNIDQFT